MIILYHFPPVGVSYVSSAEIAAVMYLVASDLLIAPPSPKVVSLPHQRYR